MRKELPEPVFGQIKQARGFLMRCFENVRAAPDYAKARGWYERGRSIQTW